jgi:hypothetical protein
MYDEISDILNQEGRCQANVIVMGDFNIIVGQRFTNKLVGHFELGKRN